MRTLSVVAFIFNGVIFVRPIGHPRLQGGLIEMQCKCVLRTSSAAQLIREDVPFALRASFPVPSDRLNGVH